MLQTILFYLISFGTVLSALGVIISRSAVYSVLCLVSAMCMMAGLFILLKAFLVAAILVLVYAGALLVLFLFVVMLIDFKAESHDWKIGGLKGRPALSPFLAVLIGLLLFIQSCLVIRSIPRLSAVRIEGTTRAIGMILFNNYVLPFELTSFLLLAAVVSVVVLAKKGS